MRQVAKCTLILKLTLLCIITNAILLSTSCVFLLIGRVEVDYKVSLMAHLYDEGNKVYWKNISRHQHTVNIEMP